MIKKHVNIGIIGFGTVGSGVVRLLRDNMSLIEKRIGSRCRIARICDKNIRSSRPGVSVDRRILTSDPCAVIHDPEIDIVVELIGGYEPACRIVCDALAAGKHIVTANKAILSKYWNRLFDLARRNRRLIYFEAAVGGGIPVIQGLNEGLAANRIGKIMGILNGTTNYILSKMSEGMGFADALAAAKESGFAEADPSFDIKGLDAAHKLSILASIAAGSWVNPKDIYCEGITGIRTVDMNFAREHLGMNLKLLGIIKDHAGVFEVRVHPAFIPMSHPFSAVQNEYNAVFIHGDAVGDVMFYGKGAGRMAAASAVVSDIIFLARQVANGTAGRIPYVINDRKKDIRILPMDEIKTRYYLRFTTIDRPGVLAKIAGILGRNGVSISSVFQQEPVSSRKGVPIIIVTHQAREGDIHESLKMIDRLVVVRARTIRIRIED